MARALWRIAKQTRDFPASDLGGGGAATTGGRWNSKGRRVVYASGSIALALLETMAHLGDERHPRNRYLVRVSVPDAVWLRRRVASSPPVRWDAEPAGIGSIAYGDRWLGARASVLMVVPSVTVPEEENVLINPEHPHARKLRARVVRRIAYDPRLLLRR